MKGSKPGTMKKKPRITRNKTGPQKNKDETVTNKHKVSQFFYIHTSSASQKVL